MPIIDTRQDPRYIIKFSGVGLWHVLLLMEDRTNCGVSAKGKLITFSSGRIRKLCQKCFEEEIRSGTPQQ